MSTSSLNVSGILSSINDAFNGKTSGIDVASTVSAMMQVERQPETQMQQQQTDINNQVSLLTSINTDLQSLATAAQALEDPLGTLSQRAVSSNASSIVSGYADPTAALGSHTVTVSRLATIASTYSDPIPSGTSLGGSEIDVSYGDAQKPAGSDKIVIPSADASLQQAVDYINSPANNFGVTASVVTDTTGSRLALVSKTSGAAGDLTVSSSALHFSQGTPGVDAQLTVDGVPIDSASNSVSSAIAGVTLQLAGAAPTTPTVITVQADTTQAAQTISTFITAYNKVVGDINQQFSVGATSGSEGPLAGDAGLRSLQNQLLSAITFSSSGTGQYVNLQSLGIAMQDDGTLQMNTTALTDTLSNHYADFLNFFQSGTQAFGNHFNTVMIGLTNPVSGPVAVDISGLKQTSQFLTSDINNFEVRMQDMQQRLTQQYSLLNTLLEQYPVQMQQISAQLGSLPGATKSSQ